MKHECFECHTRTIEKLIEKFNPPNGVARELQLSAYRLLIENQGLTNPHLSTLLHRLAKKQLQEEDLFFHEKSMANRALMEQYSNWKKKVDESDDSFLMATRLAVAGNIIDYGAHSAKANVPCQVSSLLEKPFVIDERDALRQEIKQAGSILYLGDNAGEIVFDKLLIETINHPNVTFVVRGFPVINDATRFDAEQTGLDKICRIIDNGHDAPSTLMEHASSQLREAFENADLIISKGQGNFEGLMHSGKENIFFMLMAKCEPIAELLKVKKGDLVVASQGRIRS
ncbi:MAG: damage-control phosphatase ARMT1 family protein [Bacteroidales bacterium]